MAGLVTLICVQDCESWTSHHGRVAVRNAMLSRSKSTSSLQPSPMMKPFQYRISTTARGTCGKTSTSKLSMYNLPPGGGGGGNNNDIGSLVQNVLGLVVIVGILVSPVGGFLLSIMNSFLALIILLPLLGIVGFQVWSYFNFISGPCPNCGAPAKVLKSQPNAEAQPSICFNCGSILQANYDNTGIDNVTGKRSVLDDDSATSTMFDALFGMNSRGPGSTTNYDPTTTTTRTTTRTTIVDTVIVEDDDDLENKKRPPRFRSDPNVIDVDSENDKPFQ